MIITFGEGYLAYFSAVLKRGKLLFLWGKNEDLKFSESGNY